MYYINILNSCTKLFPNMRHLCVDLIYNDPKVSVSPIPIEFNNVLQRSQARRQVTHDSNVPSNVPATPPHGIFQGLLEISDSGLYASMTE